ncbi:hypothetical protein M3484_00700 [Pseudomonas sp. GX19020]|uniref:hypothetical protein n=1 Tax=Pseudomonas sp. GX19020 TaxID=2942277 RepID=UPI002019DEDD|nr:hypothetical protein [Pseudomonas sp. GX19020]MCL4065095.1 hypothetical protein [Pseudomonas sp. GX19020]
MKFDRTLAQAMQRLAQFEEWTGTEAPSAITEGEGKDRTFAHDFLIYANENNLSLDWLWMIAMLAACVPTHSKSELVRQKGTKRSVTAKGRRQMDDMRDGGERFRQLAHRVNRNLRHGT